MNGPDRSPGRRYLFHPLESRGVLVGLGAGQLATLAVSALLGVGVVRVAPAGVGFLAAAVLFGAGAALACWPVRGRPTVSWLPVVAAWLRSRTPVVSCEPGRGSVATRPGRVDLRARRRRGTDPVDTGPGGSGRRTSGPERSGRGTIGPDSSARATGGPERGGGGMIDRGGSRRRPAVRRSMGGRRRQAVGLPLPLGRLQIFDLEGHETIGVVRDPRAATWAAVLRVQGRSFSLLDPADKERQLAAYGAMLAGLGRAGSPVHRLQWLQRSMPGDSDGLARAFGTGAAGAPATCRDSYRELIDRAGPATQDHEVLVVLAVHERHAARAIKAYGAGPAGVGAVLGRELRLLQAQLRHVDLAVPGPLRSDEIVRLLRGACSTTPGGERALPEGDSDRRHSRRALALATEDGWSSYRTDGAWHATYWIAAWPRVEVGPDFLTGVLLAPGRRTVSVTMAPVAPERAVRDVEAARTAELADEQLRRQAGFLPSARRRRASDGVARREAELADGHAEFRFSGYLTVSASSRAELDAGCAEVEQAAHQARLDLRRLYGQQEEAFSWTLPLARGLR